MNRTVSLTAIASLIVGGLAGHLVTRLWKLDSFEDSAKVVQEPLPAKQPFSRESTAPSHSTRIPTLEAPDRLEHWSLNAFQSLGGIIKDAAAADRKALSNQASAPLTHLECRNPGSMEKVTGIGGFFFRVKNSNALNEWYEQHLGVRKVGERDEDGSWWQDAGPTVFASESEEDQAGGPAYAWRINFRVRDLDAMVAQLRAAGQSVEVDATLYPNGRFAHLRDPEGNRIELWEPAGADLVRPPEP
jgi:predicted enzyme related to lactoylglutathione lyase